MQALGRVITGAEGVVYEIQPEFADCIGSGGDSYALPENLGSLDAVECGPSGMCFKGAAGFPWVGLSVSRFKGV